MSSSAQASDLIRRLRRSAGLSQRALGQQAGTSGATVAAYESGRKEPRLSTLERLAEAMGHRLDVRVSPSEEGGRLRARREWRSLAIAAATASVVDGDFEAARKLALINIARMRDVIGSNRPGNMLDQWIAVLDEGPRSVHEVLMDPSDHGHDMRQMTPFAGLLTDEARLAALAVADAFGPAPS